MIKEYLQLISHCLNAQHLNLVAAASWLSWHH